MARNTYYTEEENEILRNIIKRHPETTSNAEIAKMAHEFGACKHRTNRALEQQIRKLKTPPEAAEEEEAMDPELAIARKEAKQYREKYEGLLDAIIGTAKLFPNSNKNLCLDYQAIARWIGDNEPERVNAKIEDLQLEKQKGE